MEGNKAWFRRYGMVCPWYSSGTSIAPAKTYANNSQIISADDMFSPGMHPSCDGQAQSEQWQKKARWLTHAHGQLEMKIHITQVVLNYDHIIYSSVIDEEQSYLHFANSSSKVRRESWHSFAHFGKSASPPCCNFQLQLPCKEPFSAGISQLPWFHSLCSQAAPGGWQGWGTCLKWELKGIRQLVERSPTTHG